MRNLFVMVWCIKNNYINSPAILTQTLQLKNNPNIFFAGQITGVEGYVESAASGYYCRD
jgi:methylenetetrahydrofolate--tRNA-(uracil-5-)-methyltransferase